MGVSSAEGKSLIQSLNVTSFGKKVCYSIRQILNYSKYLLRVKDLLLTYITVTYSPVVQNNY
jgi:hypothetical protein